MSSHPSPPLRRSLSAALALVISACLTVGATVVPSAGAHADPVASSSPAATPAALEITELMVDSANYNKADGYEYIEVTNTTSSAIDFADYTLAYVYPIDEDKNSSVALWPSEPRAIIIEAGASVVFWVKNGSNDALTVADFNKKWGTTLAAGRSLIEVHAAGMANGAPRGMQVQTNTGEIINRAWYNLAGASNVQADRGIHYGPRPGDPTKQTLLETALPTPGSADDRQIVNPLSVTPVDAAAPVVVDSTASLIVPGKPLAFSFSITDDVRVLTATLRVRTNVDTEDRVVNLTRGTGSAYAFEMAGVDLEGKRYLDYSLAVSDGAHHITTAQKRLLVEGASAAPVRLDRTDGEWLGGTVDVIGASEAVSAPLSLYIDGARAETTPSLEREPQFAFEATQTDTFFRNGVLAGGQVLNIFDRGTYANVETIVTRIPLKHITAEHTVTVSIYAGTKAAPAIDLGENNDDFQVKAMRLVLPDGRTLTPRGYANPETYLNLGDSAGRLDFYDAIFTIPSDALTGARTSWDTTTAASGPHRIEARLDDGSASVERTVNVDNDAPQLRVTGVEDGALKQGAFIIDADVSDDGVGLASSTVTLDGAPVSLPLQASSVSLAAGQHHLKLSAVDKLGNTAAREVVFTTPVEQPESGAFAPAEGEIVHGDRVALSTEVTDPTGDAVDVAFLEGRRTKLTSEVLHASGTVNDAASLSRGTAVALTADEVAALGSVDGLVTRVESSSALPYELFAVKTAGGASTGEGVRVTWQGAAEEGADVHLYAKRADGSGWSEVDRHRVTSADRDEDAGSSEREGAPGNRQTTPGAAFQGSFELQAIVGPEAIAVDGTVTMLVQHSEGYAGADLSSRTDAVASANPADVPRSDYDFTLAWESDTQYYNEQYYEHQVKIHDYVLSQRTNKNIQYVFHTGDIVDDYDQEYEWKNADPQYARFDEAKLPYGVLAGNHDVGHLLNDYSEYSKWFGEARYRANPWYGGSHKDNRGHFDLFSAGGIDFIVVSMGWAPGDEEIAWMNAVLKAHPGRVGIINLHEFLLTTGGLGPVPQRIMDEVVKPNPGVRMVMSGHYHDAFTRTDGFDDDGDGTKERTVTSMLFDYQGLPEGGQGYLRLLHFSNEQRQMLVRTYSPSLDRYNSDEPSLLGPDSDKYLYQDFNISYDQLGIKPKTRVLTTDAFTAESLSSVEIGRVAGVQTPGRAQVCWHPLAAGEHGWYARIADGNGGVTLSPVHEFVSVEDAGAVPPSGDPAPSVPAPDQPAPGGTPTLISVSRGDGSKDASADAEPDRLAQTGNAAGPAMLLTALVMTAVGSALVARRRLRRPTSNT